MSRSYKKSPYVVDKKNKKDKRLANKKVRNTAWIANGMGYKKVYETWDICDWKWRYDPREIEENDFYRPLYKYRIK